MNIDIVVNSLENIWNFVKSIRSNDIILFILAVSTIRDVIASLGVVPRRCRFSWIFYGRYDRDLVKTVLSEELHYTDQDADQFVHGMTKGELERNRKREPKVYYRMLIDVIRKCMIQGDAIYGSTHTNYYIHTMMGSQDDEIRETMCELMVHLILERMKIKKIDSIDFIIVPKSGNSRLGQAIAEKLNARCILHKSKTDKAYAKTDDSSDANYMINYNINFEGAYYLEKGKPLRGVVLDCNTSGGSQLLEAVKEFNTLIDHSRDIKFKKIEDVFTLFRADMDDGKNIDSNFADQGCRLHRIFDLTEPYKERIFKGISEGENIPYFTSESKVDGIIADMRDEKLLNLEDRGQ